MSNQNHKKLTMLTRDELKTLVSKHFNLVPAPEVKEESIENTTEHKFAIGHLVDGTEVSNQKDSEFAEGDSLFVKDEEGNYVQAPAGEHTLDSGITVVVNGEGVIEGIHRPDEAGEGALEEVQPEEVVEMAEEDIIEDVIEETSTLDIVKEVIDQLVTPAIEEMKAKLGDYEKKLEEHDNKMKEYMSATPASESKTTSKFSKSTINQNEGPKHNKRQYELALETLNSKRKK